MGPFTSLINENDELLQCNTCLESITSDTYEFDSDYEEVYCSTNCLIHSFEFGINQPWSA